MSLLCESFVCRFLIVILLMFVDVWFRTTLKRIFVAYWEICNFCIYFGLVLDIAIAYFSQLNFVHFMRNFICGMSIAGLRHVDSCGCIFGMSIAGFRHVDSWGVSEHWATGGAYVKVICDITGFRIGADWMDREATSNSFLETRTFKFSLLNDEKTVICFSTSSYRQSGVCPAVLCWLVLLI